MIAREFRHRYPFTFLNQKRDGRCATLPDLGGKVWPYLRQSGRAEWQAGCDHLADMPTWSTNVRFRGQSGHSVLIILSRHVLRK
jgi:hypothetical protein